jgi:hypothetical protein
LPEKEEKEMKKNNNNNRRRRRKKRRRMKKNKKHFFLYSSANCFIYNLNCSTPQGLLCEKIEYLSLECMCNYF